ncbi:MAG TPA: alpha/beta hydrolase [Actinocrinis sp.]|nr:alpha/beta hydrolase [Actinocrinis sp.]
MDDRLASALHHWAPRLTGNGILPADLARVAAAISAWRDWCGAWIAVAEEHESLGRAALADGRFRSAGEHLRRAAVSYHFGRFVFYDDLELAAQASQGAQRCLTDALPHLDPPGRRVTVPFDGAQLVGTLRTPYGPGHHPLVLMVPGLDSTKEELLDVEDTFLRRGLATFSVDGPGQGETAPLLPIRADYEAAGRALLAVLRRDPAIDPERIGVWGVSLGGYYAARIAGALPGILACAALSAPFEMRDVIEHGPALTREAFRRRSHCADDAEARRKADLLTLIDHAPKIACPLLVVCGGRDGVTPPLHQARLAEEGGAEEFLFFEQGNHGCTNLLDHHRPFTADWMARKLAPAHRSGTSR